MLVYSAIGAAAVVVLTSALVRARRSRARVVENGAARDRFVERFAGRGAPAAMLAHAYDVLRERHRDGTADLRPEASLQQEFGLSRLDLEDAALVIVARSGGQVPRSADLDRLDERVATVGQLVDFLAAFGRTEAAPA